MKNESGQSLVELALIMPIFLLMLVGIFDFGRVLYTYSHLHMAAQESVRLGGLGKNDSEISTFAKDYIHIGDPAKLKVVITPNDTNRKTGQYVTVVLTYPLEILTPIISNLLPNPFELITESTIRVE